jgi:hypothetical protein
MVPALRLPSTHDATDIIRVYLRVPPGRSISARYIEAQGRNTLLFPPRDAGGPGRAPALSSRVGTPIDKPPLSGDALRTLGRLNDCGHCHIPNHRREISIDAAPFPRRETDASGFYVPLAVLRSEVALAATRPLDPNAGDPYVDVKCGKELAHLVQEGDWIWYRCADGGVPVGCRDVRGALAAGDRYTAAFCASRRYLYDHMDEAARRAFAVSFRECGI